MIEFICLKCFRFGDNLEQLELNNNCLTKIESNSFQHLNKLKRLNIHSNQIEQGYMPVISGKMGLDFWNFWGIIKCLIFNN